MTWPGSNMRAPIRSNTTTTIRYVYVVTPALERLIIVETDNITRPSNVISMYDINMIILFGIVH